MDLFLLLGLDVDSANTSTTEELKRKKKILVINGCLWFAISTLSLLVLEIFSPD
jgi:hypothetical protein